MFVSNRIEDGVILVTGGSICVVRGASEPELVQNNRQGNFFVAEFLAWKLP